MAYASQRHYPKREIRVTGEMAFRYNPPQDIRNLLFTGVVDQRPGDEMMTTALLGVDINIDKLSPYFNGRIFPDRSYRFLMLGRSKLSDEEDPFYNCVVFRPIDNPDPVTIVLGEDFCNLRHLGLDRGCFFSLPESDVVRQDLSWMIQNQAFIKRNLERRRELRQGHRLNN